MRSERGRITRTVAVGGMILAAAFSMVLSGYGYESEMSEHTREVLARHEREKEAARKAAAEKEARAAYLCRTNQSEAEAAGSINFFGFYTGMPKADAEALAAQYGIEPTENTRQDTIQANVVTHEVYAFFFSFDDVLRITKGPNSIEEEILIVADQLQATSMRDYSNHNLSPRSFSFSTRKGIELRLDDRWCFITDRPRLIKANEDKTRQVLMEAEQDIRTMEGNIRHVLESDGFE